LLEFSMLSINASFSLSFDPLSGRVAIIVLHWRKGKTNQYQWLTLSCTMILYELLSMEWVRSRRFTSSGRVNACNGGVLCVDANPSNCLLDFRWASETRRVGWDTGIWLFIDSGREWWKDSAAWFVWLWNKKKRVWKRGKKQN
jgi:hypothetical protein